MQRPGVRNRIGKGEVTEGSPLPSHSPTEQGSRSDPTEGWGLLLLGLKRRKQENRKKDTQST